MGLLKHGVSGRKRVSYLSLYVYRPLTKWAKWERNSRAYPFLLGLVSNVILLYIQFFPHFSICWLALPCVMSHHRCLLSSLIFVRYSCVNPM